MELDTFEYPVDEHRKIFVIQRLKYTQKPIE